MLAHLPDPQVGGPTTLWSGRGPTTLPKQSSNIAKISLSNRCSRACQHVLAARGKDSTQRLLPWPILFHGHRARQGLQGPGPATSSPTPPGHIPSGKELSYRLYLLGPFPLTLGSTTLRFPVSPRSMVQLKESRSLWPRSPGPCSRCPREAHSRKPRAHDLSPAAPPTIQKHDPHPHSTTRMARRSRVIAGVFAACHSVPNRGIGKDNEND